METTDSSDSHDAFLKLECQELLIGMFVSEIDCSWNDTPFPLGGFHVRKAEDIQMLSKFCKTVHIDTTKGAHPVRKKRDHLTILSSARRASPTAASLKVNRELYPISTTVKKEIDKSAAHYQELNQSFADLAAKVRLGEKLTFSVLDSSVEGLIESAIANPQTLIWLLNTDHFPVVDTAYSVRAAIWATVLARQFGLVRSEIRALFMGTLLADIGLYLLPERLVNKRGKFRKKEFLAYRKHVNFGLDLLGQYSEIDSNVQRIVRCHHERNDGLGFPKRLKGEQIPALARFAHMAFCFERIIRSLSTQENVSPAKAIARLYKQRDLKFPEQLVVEFIHLMGMYPIGSLVELNTGEIAIVLEQHSHEKLCPKIAVLTNVSQEKLKQPKIVTLSDETEARSVLSSLGPTHKGINAYEFRFNFSGKRVSIGNFGFRF